MKVQHIAFATLALVAIACAPSSTEESGAEGNAAATEGASKSFTLGALTITKEHASAKVKAKEIDADRPDFDSCETDVDYLTIKGTAHDAEINKLLRGEWELPTAASCEYPQSYGAGATITLLDPEQGFLAVTEGESYYEGGAHPNNGTEFKLIDLRSGKLLNLGDFVTADSAPKLHDLVNKKIETSLTRVYFDQPRFDQGGKKRSYEVKVLPAEDQEMMKNFAGYYFTTYADDKEAPEKVENLHDFTISGTGIRIDLANQLPHAFGGMDASYKLLWNDLQTAGVLRTDNDLVARAKAARPKQPKNALATE